MAWSFPVGAVDAFSGAGGIITITMDWKPDPKVISKNILEIAGYLENMQPPLRASKAIGQADMHEHFAGNHGPNGEEWAPLDEDYAVKKASMGGDPNDPLTLTGALEEAAAGDSAWMVDTNNIFFNTGALPEYGLFHEAGSGAEQAGMAAFGRAAYREVGRESGEKGGEHQSQGIGRGKALPRRPFIGLSAEAELQIFEVFDLWFAAGTSIGISGTGTVQERIGGRFGSKLYPDVGRLSV
jgi:phage gpG-like protein